MKGEISVLCTGLALTDIGAELPDTKEKFSLNILASLRIIVQISRYRLEVYVSFDERKYNPSCKGGSFIVVSLLRPFREWISLKHKKVASQNASAWKTKRQRLIIPESGIL